MRKIFQLLIVVLLVTPFLAAEQSKPALKVKPVALRVDRPSGDWAQWGGGPQRNNTPEVSNLPTEWNVGGFDPKTGAWKKEKAKNIKWVARLGSQSYGNPVVADGKV